MNDAVIIMTRSAPEGLKVCVVGWAGDRKFGEVLTEHTLMLYARQAAEQGFRLMVEVQPDGVRSWPGEVR